MKKKKRLFENFKKKWEYSIAGLGLKSDLKRKEEGEYSGGAKFQVLLDSYSDHCKRISDYVSVELNNSLNKVKPSKLNDEDVKKYHDLIISKFNGILKSGEQYFDERIASERASGAMPVETEIGVKTSFKGIINKNEHDAKIKIDLAISDYNLNPQNWLRLNQDKLIFLTIGFLFSYLPSIINSIIKCFTK